MSINILMPALSPTMTEGKLAKWHVKVGDAVKSGQVVCEIETDKATMEVEAVDEGKVGQIVVPEGTEGVAVNAVIAVLLEEGEKAGAAPAAAPAPKAEAKPEPKAEAKPAAPAAAPPPKPAPQAASQPAASSGGQRIFASPLAKRIAAEKGVDLAGVKGSGPNGRIVKADVEGAKPGAARPAPAAGAAAGAPKGAPAAQPIFTAPGDQRIPHSAVRKVIARRMLESKQTVPHFYLTMEMEIDALLAARAAINEVARKKNAKVSVNDMVIKACARALRDHPECNASWSEDEMIQYGAVDISVAVATDRGLITPIVRNADMKGAAQISIEMKDLAGRAKEGKLKLEEFQGGGFTISNLGMFGVKEFAAIINPPQAMILAVGAGEERVVARNGQMVIRNMMSLTLAVDHRVVDGAMGAQFMQTLKAYIEQPAAMLV
ncbi:MAG: pyruvate dehydrogenase complex dihydrolipoamide acetyltransferase [Proteobacteria bacterium]|nr:pyruvate dehydrogenase complex dihydrolipoamide acetyltransferase [Pseudomonadota bacterium]